MLYVNSTVGVGGPNSTINIGRMFVALKPKKERGQLERDHSAAAAATGQRHRHGGLLPDDPEHQCRRPDHQEPVSVHDAIERHRDALSDRAGDARQDLQVDGLLDVNTDLYVKNPQIEIEIDREKAAFYGITVDQIRQELFNAFGNRQVATIYTPINDYQVILETQPEFQADTTGLSKIFSRPALAQHRRGPPPGGGVMGTGTPTACRSRYRR